METVLVDTSVWIDHFRTSNRLLRELLDEEQVLMHPFVLGEIACGNLYNRAEILGLMHALPAAPKVEDHDVLLFIDQWELMGRGIGLIDVHLLASCLKSHCSLWTFDKRLKTVAEELHAIFTFS